MTNTEEPNSRYTDEELLELFHRASEGDEEAFNILYSLYYDELHRRAANRMRDQPLNHTLQATALIGEVYQKMRRGSLPAMNDRTHFLALASTIMRQVLVDHARGRNRVKRQAGAHRVPLEHATVAFDSADEIAGLLDVDAVIAEIRELDEVGASLLEMRLFGGFTMQDIADELGESKRTAERKWTFVKTFLKSRLGESPPPGAEGAKSEEGDGEEGSGRAVAAAG